MKARDGEKLWSDAGRAQLEKLPLATWASRRRQDLLELLDRMNPTIEELTAVVEQEAKKWPEVLRLMTHPGVGSLTALAFVLIIGTPERFQCGKQIGSYVGLIPSENSSAGHQRLGHITKQGSSLLRFLLVRSSTSSGTLGFRLAASVRAPGDASAKKYCQGGDGPKTGGSAVLDVAERLGVFAVGRIRFERGTARYRTWREVGRRAHDWASRSLARGEFEVVIMVEVLIEEMFGSESKPTERLQTSRGHRRWGQRTLRTNSHSSE